MLITIVSATPFEIAPLVEHLNKYFIQKENSLFEKENLKIRVLVTGVGMPLTAFQLGLYLAKEQPNLLINAGVAGAINRKLNLGDVVHVVSDCFGDIGTEEADGSFTNVHQMNLIGSDDPPFKNGVLHNQNVAAFDFLPKASGVTINKVHGHQASIDAFTKLYPVDVESMESAAVFLACLQTNTSFFAVRSISNYVESRNKESWELGLAIQKLNAVLISMVSSL